MFCPDVSRLAHRIAIENARVKADVIEVSELAAVRERFRVTSVPRVLIDDEHELVGSQSEGDLLAALGV